MTSNYPFCSMNNPKLNIFTYSLNFKRYKQGLINRFKKINAHEYKGSHKTFNPRSNYAVIFLAVLAKKIAIASKHINHHPANPAIRFEHAPAKFHE